MRYYHKLILTIWTLNIFISAWDNPHGKKKKGSKRKVNEGSDLFTIYYYC